MLVVLLQQIHGVHGYTFLRAAQEKRARVHSACDTPRHHAHVGVVRTQVCTRWSQHILRPAQYLRPYRDVLLLYGVCDGPQVPEVHLVEEVPHRLPDGPVRADLQPPAASVVPAVMPVPARLRLLDRHARLPVPLPVQRLLQGALLQVREEGQDQWTLHDRHGRQQQFAERQERLQAGGGGRGAELVRVVRRRRLRAAPPRVIVQ